MKAVLIQFMVLLLGQIAVASTSHDDADAIHIRLKIQDFKLDDAAAGSDSKDITTLGNHLLALSGKELQMPKSMRDPLIKKRAFNLCREHGYARSENIKSKMISAVPFTNDFKLVQWVEGNLQPVSAAKTSHWNTISENGKGRHGVSGPFAVFSSLTCVR